MVHEMKLHESPFKKIKSGKKTVELRLYDDKRRKINIGDKILFTNLTSQEMIAVNLKVSDLKQIRYRVGPYLEENSDKEYYISFVFNNDLTLYFYITDLAYSKNMGGAYIPNEATRQMLTF